MRAYDLGAGERLDDVVVGAELEPDDAVGLGAAGGDHDHGQFALAAQDTADVAAVAVGQREVEQDEVRLGRPRGVERLLCGARHGRLEALAAEEAGERLGDRGLVLHDQDAGRHAVECSRRGSGRDQALQRLDRCFEGAWRVAGQPGRMFLNRTRIAAGGTLAALAALAAVALAAGGEPQPSASAASGEREVRTAIVRARDAAATPLPVVGDEDDHGRGRGRACV
jgi:hypothetical protein